MNANKVDAIERLKEEHLAWTKSHPKGLVANPCTVDGGTETNWLKWKCAIPGRPKTLWEGGVYHLVLEFTTEYPYHPPTCRFEPPIFHPNVFPSGKVALSLLDKDWVPQITIQQVLLGIQLLLDDPNFSNPAQAEAFVVHSQGKYLYEERIKEQAKQMNPSLKVT